MRLRSRTPEEVALRNAAGRDQDLADLATARALFGERDLKVAVGDHALGDQDLAERHPLPVLEAPAIRENPLVPRKPLISGEVERSVSLFDRP